LLNEHLPRDLRARVQERVLVELPSEDRVDYPAVRIVEHERQGPAGTALAASDVTLAEPLAEEVGRPVGKRFGSLKNVARRLLDSVRFVAWADEWFDPDQAGHMRISLDSW
jgi:hypothetical protein